MPSRMEEDGRRVNGHATSDYAEKLYSLSLHASKAGKDAEAHQLLCVGLQHAPEPELRSVLLFARVMTRARLCRWNEALQDADSLIRIRPNWSKAHESRGCALHGLGLDAAAFEAYESCLRLDPNNKSAMTVLSVRDRAKAEARARAVVPGLGYLDLPGFPFLADPKAIPPLPHNSMQGMEHQNARQEDVHGHVAEQREDHDVGSRSRSKEEVLDAEGAAHEGSAAPPDEQGWEESSFLLASQDEEQLRREVQRAKQVRQAEEAETIWRAQQEESRRTWDAERDALLEKMDQYQKDLTQLQGASPVCFQPAKFMAGERVRIWGLQQEKELNGQEGTVVAVHQPDHQIHVKLGQGRIVPLQAEKLEQSASTATFPPSAVLGGSPGEIGCGDVSARKFIAPPPPSIPDADADADAEHCSEQDQDEEQLPFDMKASSLPQNNRGRNRARMMHVKRLAQTRELKSVAPSPRPPALTAPLLDQTGADEGIESEVRMSPSILVSLSQETPEGSIQDSDFATISGVGIDTEVPWIPSTPKTQLSVERQPEGLVPIYPDLRADGTRGSENEEVEEEETAAVSESDASKAAKTDIEEIEIPFDDIPVPPPCYTELIPLLSAGALQAGMLSSTWKGVKLVKFTAMPQSCEKPDPTPSLRVSDVHLPTYRQALCLLKPEDSAIASASADIPTAADEHTDTIVAEEADGGERELVLTLFEARGSGMDAVPALVCVSILPTPAGASAGTIGAIEPQFISSLTAFESEELIINQTIAFSHMVRQGAELEPLSAAGDSAYIYISVHSPGGQALQQEEQRVGRLLYQAVIPVAFRASDARSHDLVDAAQKPVPGAAIRIGYAYYTMRNAADDERPMESTAGRRGDGGVDIAPSSDGAAGNCASDSAAQGAFSVKPVVEEAQKTNEVQGGAQDKNDAIHGGDGPQMGMAHLEAHEHLRDWL